MLVDAVCSGAITYLKSLAACPVLWQLAANEYVGPEPPALGVFQMYAEVVMGNIVETFAAAKKGNSGTDAHPA